LGKLYSHTSGGNDDLPLTRRRAKAFAFCESFSFHCMPAAIRPEWHAEDEVRDAGLISAASRAEHQVMAGYGCVRSYANLLDDAEGGTSFHHNCLEI
jgi:hypothetical protein